MAGLEKELERIERGEAWNKDDEVVRMEVKKPLDKVIPVRLSASDWSNLRKEANQLGVGSTTLARMWILERLRRARDFKLALDNSINNQSKILASEQKSKYKSH